MIALVTGVSCCCWIVMWRQQIPHSCSDTSLGVRRNVIYKNEGIKWQKFQDGFPNLFIEDVKNVTGRDGQLSLCINCSCYVDIQQMQRAITFRRDRSFPQPAEFWAEPRNLFVLPWKWARPQNLGFSMDIVKFVEIHFKTNVYI